MKNEINKPELEALLSCKPFSELNSTESDWVLQQMSAADYEAQRAVLLASKAWFSNAAVPPPPSLEKVLAQRQPIPAANTNSPGWWSVLNSRRVPVWQMAMALAMGWVFGFLGKTDPTTPLSVVPQIVYQTDTVIKEIPVYIARGAEKLAALTDSQSLKNFSLAHPVSAAESALEKSNDLSFGNGENRSDKAGSAKGVMVNGPISNDRELLQLMVDIR